VGGPADESSSEESGLRIVHRCSDFWFVNVFVRIWITVIFST
jgi:hypothetical protein